MSSLHTGYAGACSRTRAMCTPAKWLAEFARRFWFDLAPQYGQASAWKRIHLSRDDAAACDAVGFFNAAADALDVVGFFNGSTHSTQADLPFDAGRCAQLRRMGFLRLRGLP